MVNSSNALFNAARRRIRSSFYDMPGIYIYIKIDTQRKIARTHFTSFERKPAASSLYSRALRPDVKPLTLELRSAIEIFLRKYPRILWCNSISLPNAGPLAHSTMNIVEIREQPRPLVVVGTVVKFIHAH